MEGRRPPGCVERFTDRFRCLCCSKPPPKALVTRIYNSFAESNTYTTAPAYHFLIVHKRRALHLKPLSNLQRVLWFDAVLHGQTDMVKLGVRDCPNRARNMPQDMLDSALLFLCAQDCPSLETVKALVVLGADVNAVWNPSHYLTGTKDQPRDTRKPKRRRGRRKKWLLRYMASRYIVVGDTPLILACRKRSKRYRSRKSTSRLVKLTQCLRGLGAKPFGALSKNVQRRDAYLTALESKFFRVCFVHRDWFDQDLERFAWVHGRRCRIQGKG